MTSVFFRIFSAALLCVVASSVSLRAADEKPAGDGKLLLKLSGMQGDNALPGKEPRNVREKAKRAVIEDFLKKFPHIDFLSETGIKVPGSAAESAILMAMAGGSAGDVL